MQGNAVLKLLTAILGCFLSIFLIYQILYSRTGGVAMLITFLGIAGVITAVIDPKNGLYITALSTVYLDFGKKVAVYYGEVSQMTTIQVLMVSIFCLIGTYAGIFSRLFIFRTIKIQRSDTILFGLSGIIVASLFFLNRDEGTATAGQLAVNGGLFVGLIPTVAILLKEKEEVIKFVRFLFWILLPWPIWGIRQYFWGFTQLEWEYAYTGLSPATTAHMLMSPDPAPFGFGSFAGNYGIITLFVPLGLWLAFHSKNRRFLYLVATAVFFAGCIFARKRGVIVYPFIALAFFWFCLRPQRTVAVYALGFGLFAVGVISSGYLLDNISRISDFTRSLVPNEWGQTALSLETFSERLYGWKRLTEPDSYSLLGRLGSDWSGPATGADAAQEYNHDIINKILINFGVVGWLVSGGTAFVLLRSLHRLVLSISNKETKSAAAILIACVIPMVFISFVGGGNLNTNPHNFVYWGMIGGALAISRASRKQEERLKIPAQDISIHDARSPSPALT